MLSDSALSFVCFIFSSILLSSTLTFKLEGSQTSYAKFQTWKPCQNGSLHFEFKTSMPNALLLYADDGGYTDFFQLYLVVGSLHLKVHLGESRSTLKIGNNLNNSQWHKVYIIRNGQNVTLKVDRLTVSESKQGFRRKFGRGRNSPLYIGGLPYGYKDRISELTIQHIVFEPYLNGEIRNVLYSNCGGKLIRPEMLEYSGVVDSTNRCMQRNPCQNGGVCITTDDGTTCDCSQTLYEGITCEIESQKSEVTFFGSEYFFYDLAPRGQANSSYNDKVDFYFRTRQQTGFLFYTGEGSDYISIAIKNGHIIAAVNLGSGEIKVDISPRGYRFDDNQWHHLVLIRRTRELQLSVDGVHVKEGSTVGAYTILDSKVLYIGGHPHATKLDQGIIVTNYFKGCMKKIIYTADRRTLDLSKMVASSNSLVHVHGNVMFNKCQEIVESRPITFTTPESFLVLPRLEVGKEGASLSFTFQTNEASGVIMYHSFQSNRDFFAFEVFEGYLWFIIDLGSGPYKGRILQKVSDGKPHLVTMEHFSTGNSGYIMLDGERKDYTVTGESTHLNLDGELFVGGTGDRSNKVPKEMWAGTLGYGFVGCFQDLMLNGNKVDLLTTVRKNMKTGIIDSCRAESLKCSTSPCLNGGACMEGWNRYVCDCRDTEFTGTQCQSVAVTLEFDGGQYMRLELSTESVTEVEEVSIRFRTERERGLLLLMSSDKSSDMMELYLDNGIIKLEISISNRRKALMIGRHRLNDHTWHTVFVTRRGDTITLKLDGHDPIAVALSLPYVKYRNIKTILLGSPGPLLADSLPKGNKAMSLLNMDLGYMSRDDSRLRQLEGFVGSMQQFYFNGRQYIQLAKSNSLPNMDLTARFDTDKPMLRDVVTFKSKDSYVVLPKLTARLQFSIYFKFKTTEVDGLLLYNGGQGVDFIALELQSGYLLFLYDMGDGAHRVVVNTMSQLNDNQWHLVSIQRPGIEKIQVRVDDNYPTISDLSRSNNFYLDLTDKLYIGGTSQFMFNKIPSSISSRHGFQGCMASVDFNGQRPNLAKDSIEIFYSVEEGCTGPSNSCRSDSCASGGVCLQQWNSYKCDCDMTTYTGQTCSQESTTATFGPMPSLITFYYPPNNLPSTHQDKLAFGIRTTQNTTGTVVLVRVESSSGSDFMQVEMTDGCIFMAYNMGAPLNIPITDPYHKVNDGAYHIIRITRDGANATLQVDNKVKIKKVPSGPEQKWTFFNNQSKIYVGGENGKGDTSSFFQGSLSGLVFNKIPVLDLASKMDPFVTFQGKVTFHVPSRKLPEWQSTEGIKLDDSNKKLDGILRDIIIRQKHMVSQTMHEFSSDENMKSWKSTRDNSRETHESMSHDTQNQNVHVEEDKSQFFLDKKLKTDGSGFHLFSDFKDPYSSPTHSGDAEVSDTSKTKNVLLNEQSNDNSASRSLTFTKLGRDDSQDFVLLSPKETESGSGSYDLEKEDSFSLHFGYDFDREGGSGSHIPNIYLYTKDLGGDGSGLHTLNTQFDSSVGQHLAEYSSNSDSDLRFTEHIHKISYDPDPVMKHPSNQDKDDEAFYSENAADVRSNEETVLVYNRWQDEKPRNPTIKMKKHFEDSLNYVIPKQQPKYLKYFNFIKSQVMLRKNQRQRNRVSVGNPRVLHLQHLLRTTNTVNKHGLSKDTQTTPHNDVTDEIIVPVGSGDMECPPDDEDECNNEDNSDDIIQTTVEYIYKSTLKPPLKSTIYNNPCENKNDPKCGEGTDWVINPNPDYPKPANSSNSLWPASPSATTAETKTQRNMEQSEDVNQEPNIWLILGILGGVALGMIILTIVLCKFCSRDEGTYKVDESQNFTFLEKKQPSNGNALLGNHSSGGKSGKKKDVKEWYV